LLSILQLDAGSARNHDANGNRLTQTGTNASTYTVSVLRQQDEL